MADLEEEVSAWVETVTGEKRGDLAFGDWLRDGQVLCRLANKIEPGICPRINKQAMPFKQMENVTAFIQACRKLGVLEKDVFSTVDLYEQKNLKSVCLCVYNLGSAIRSTAASFNGPYLGVAQTGAVTDVARKKQSVTQDMGFRQDIETEVREGVRKSRIAGEDPGAPTVAPAPRKQTATDATSDEKVSGSSASPVKITGPSQAVSPAQTTPVKAAADGEKPSPGGYPSPASAASSDAKSTQATPSKPSRTSLSASDLEAEVRGWLEEVSGERGDEDLGDWLHNGKVLCKVANVLQPGICPRINSSDMPFKQMENITAFIQACRKLGVLEKDVFSTVDLYEKKNMKSVIQCIYNLASAARTTAPSFQGPYLGVARKAAVSDVAREKGIVTQDMGYRKDIDAEVKAGVRKARVAGDDPGAAAPADAGDPGPRRLTTPAAAPAPKAASPSPADRGRASVPASQHLAPPEAEGRAASRSPSAGWSRPDEGAAVKARLAGPLLKLSPSMLGGWQLRWFEVAGGRMRYWAEPGDSTAGKAPKGEVELRGLKVHTQSGMKFDVTTASSGSRTFSLDADASAQASKAGWDASCPGQTLTLQDWVKALEQEAVLARRE